MEPHPLADRHRPDGVVRWSHQAASPGELPPLELLREGLAESQGAPAARFGRGAGRSALVSSEAQAAARSPQAVR